ncbi:protein translocase subunit SecF [Spirochaeta thermophila]|uniref:Protein-export membrane protein SecF n=1 Tax=Winmispira thermophila (strain ATCC 49972 / DSM 6192 / RI 19.B1) TaxID=665571 RepID=E0RQA8_WINT6|nr:protein translocase subunit SecF [Spirochaeta thermophila]ADN02884.1 protein-export membrane protein SecF [Spirochaeta thermophila DSM 6192]
MKVIRFTRYRALAITLSLLVIVAGGVATFFQGGFNLGIDFRAGLTERVAVAPSVSASIEDVRRALAGIPGVQVQTIGDPEAQEFLIKVKEEEGAENFRETTRTAILSALSAAFGEGNVEERSSQYIGPRFSESIASQSFLLVLVAIFFMLVYIWFRFQLAYAVGAITALFHDVFVLLGVIGAFQLEVSTATIAAILTIVGYSINDTIVVFDRIRENTQLLKERPFREIVDGSITQTLSRTLITSLTTLLAVLAIYIFTTGDIKLFAFNLIVGILVGTYSSIFIASPVMMWIRNARHREEEEMKEQRQQVLSVKEETGPPAEETGGGEPEEKGEGGGVQIVQGRRRLPRSKRKKKR